MSGFLIDPDLLGLEDAVAVVTGGAAGVGRGCSVQLARAGCHVAVVDVNAEAGERTAAEIADVLDFRRVVEPGAAALARVRDVLERHS